jgi:hypothetical protein
MAISKKTQKAIEQHVDRYKLYMKYKTVGPHSITRNQLRDLIVSGWIPSFDKVQAPVLASYMLAHSQTANASVANDKIAAGGSGGAGNGGGSTAGAGDAGQSPKLPPPIIASKTTQRGALDFLDRMMDRYIGKAADQLKTDILSTVEGQLMPIIDRREGGVIFEALQDPKIHSKNLRGLLTDKVEGWEHRWRTIIGTELNRASNWGAMDAILSNNPSKGPEALTVYKQGNKPGHGACKYCTKFWYMEDGITPRVYTMAELAANGSNVGRKAKDWLPTIDSTHPNETHILRELKPGFGFVNGSIEYIGIDHDEFGNQRKP